MSKTFTHPVLGSINIYPFKGKNLVKLSYEVPTRLKSGGLRLAPAAELKLDNFFEMTIEEIIISVRVFMVEQTTSLPVHFEPEDIKETVQLVLDATADW